MTIISALRDYVAGYTGLATGAPVWVDYLSATPTEYAVIPLAGARVSEWYVDRSSAREFPFAFQSTESTADELARLENNGFYEAFADWLEIQTNAGSLPDLGTGKTPTLIEATGWGYLYQQGQSDTGVYQVQCKLYYEQKA